jgi:uncharacterized membrane-anchored protein
VSGPGGDNADRPGAERSSNGARHVRPHPLRDELVLEVHARPFEAIAAPARGSHLAVMTETVDEQVVADHVADLCRRYGAPVPPPGAKFYSQDLGPFRLRWEQHTEFSTYTFVRPGPLSGQAQGQVQGRLPGPFAEPVIGLVPSDWLDALPGAALAAVHFALEPHDAPERDTETLSLLFGGNALIGAEVAGGAARAWSDLRTHDDGFSRLLVRDKSMSALQAGRLVQRLVEINVYRLVALLSLPVARAVSPRLRHVDAALGELTAKLADEGPGHEKALLDRLSALASEIEKIGAMTSNRFAGTRAYYDIVLTRLEQIRQQRIQGLQTFSEFLERRLLPAVNFCNATAERLDALSVRMERVGSLVRARVEVQIEVQNRDLLRSMDNRARTQFRLQRVVEGLSVIAITYYLLGLVGHGLHGLAAFGVHINIDIANAVALPVVAGVVWLIMHRARHYLGGKDD